MVFRGEFVIAALDYKGVIPIKIAVDGFGGDFAPEQIVAGCLQAASLDRIPILLTGNEQVLAPMIKGKPGSDLIEIVHASEQVGMDEAPIEAVRTKRMLRLTSRPV